jgi:hypothetical protein
MRMLAGNKATVVDSASAGVNDADSSVGNDVEA